VPDNTLNHVEEVLSGKRYKFLDPTRKAVLMLPPNALKLWLTYWMFESDEREAYPSLDELEKVMDTGRQAILSARQYLLDTGWLVKLLGSAAERYAKPSQGSHNVAVYQVDDPTKGVEDGGMKITPLKIIPNVTTVSASASTGTTTGTTSPTHACTEAHTRGGLKTSSLRSDEKPEEQNQEQKQKPMRVSSATKWTNNYDAPMPDGFNSWSQLDRSTWVAVHDKRRVQVLPVPEQEKDSVPIETKVPVPSASLTPPKSAPPPIGLTPDQEIDCQRDWKESWGFSRGFYIKDSFPVAKVVSITKEHQEIHRELWIERLERKGVRG
jgi:hypothetical protein